MKKILTIALIMTSLLGMSQTVTLNGRDTLDITRKIDIQTSIKIDLINGFSWGNVQIMTNVRYVSEQGFEFSSKKSVYNLSEIEKLYKSGLSYQQINAIKAYIKGKVESLD